MTIDSENDDFLIKKGLWEGKTLYELYGEACTPFEWHAELFKHAAEQEITKENHRDETPSTCWNHSIPQHIRSRHLN